MPDLVITVKANDGHETEFGGEITRLPLTDAQALVVDAFVDLLDGLDCNPGNGALDAEKTIKGVFPVVKIFGKTIAAKIAVPVHVSLSVEG